MERQVGRQIVGPDQIATPAEIVEMQEMLAARHPYEVMGTLAGSTRKTRRPKGWWAKRINPKIWRS